VIGHSFGGVIAQKLAGMGLSRASVAIAPAPFRGVLPLPKASLKSASPVLRNPANYRRSVALTFDQFVFGWANVLSADEARHLYERYHVPGAGLPLFQAAVANLNPWTEDKVDTKSPERGPLLLVAGEHDNTAPWTVVRAAYERQKINPSATEILSLADRGHSLVIDRGWKQVADEVMSFVVEYSGTK
ncbi:MAG TPA: alpha/beta hydrolase, partial [Glaciihabitans sp.]|nr:alpha/beta hydrolase [Glaciihabitans sp.]